MTVLITLLAAKRMGGNSRQDIRMVKDKSPQIPSNYSILDSLPEQVTITREQPAGPGLQSLNISK